MRGQVNAEAGKFSDPEWSSLFCEKFSDPEWSSLFCEKFSDPE